MAWINSGCGLLVLMQKQWCLSFPDLVLAKNLAQQLGISLLTAKVLVNRHIYSPEQAQAFLSPSLSHLKDPLEIPNILPAAKRILLAKERQEKVAVFGDYDVDGVTGTAVLLETFRFLGIKTDYYIPHRYDEGYGLSIEAIKGLAGAGVKLVVTVDCGISSVKEIDYAASLGVEVVVTDHHNLPSKELPCALALVNPKIQPDHPAKDLSGVGVAFKLAWAILKTAGIRDSLFLTSLLDLVALGTLADVVPLIDENRVLAHIGLRKINERQRLGVKHLIEAAGMKERFSVRGIHFALAPRLNAAGRLEHASKALALLLSKDATEAAQLATELNHINTRRQKVCAQIKEEVLVKIDPTVEIQDKLLFFSGDNWHPGVIGIVASQIAEIYHRPTILVGVNNGVGRGSARSVAGINIYEILKTGADFFSDFGGHRGAAGFALKTVDLPVLEKKLRQTAESFIVLENLMDKLEIEANILPDQLNLNLVQELEQLSPHGEGNPAPLFMSEKLRIDDLRRVGGEGRHLKLRLQADNYCLDAIGFGMGERAKQIAVGNCYNFAYNLEANEWNGMERVQLSLVDMRETS